MVGAWCWEHFDSLSGVSFLPFSDSSYQQMPFQDCTEKEYEELLAKMPQSVDWSSLEKFETRDMTIGSQELACSAGGCEIV
jgi:ribonucleoside-diphosphate reductase alpha chain